MSPDGVPVFSSIFAEDTIANSNYNSLQVQVEKRFSQGHGIPRILYVEQVLRFKLPALKTSSTRWISAALALSLFDARTRWFTATSGSFRFPPSTLEG